MGKSTEDFDEELDLEVDTGIDDDDDLELDDAPGVRISGFLPHIATPDDLPIGTKAKITGFDKRGLVLEKQ